MKDLVLLQPVRLAVAVTVAGLTALPQAAIAAAGEGPTAHAPIAPSSIVLAGMGLMLIGGVLRRLLDRKGRKAPRGAQ